MYVHSSPTHDLWSFHFDVMPCFETSLSPSNKNNMVVSVKLCKFVLVQIVQNILQTCEGFRRLAFFTCSVCLAEVLVFQYLHICSGVIESNANHATPLILPNCHFSPCLQCAFFSFKRCYLFTNDLLAAILKGIYHPRLTTGMV